MEKRAAGDGEAAGFSEIRKGESLPTFSIPNKVENIHCSGSIVSHIFFYIESF